ncbi:uncharacterized protein LOC111484754 isoform X1 [Cucurbita maxima]|uniref:Uncharacterized protein LOC111484754 isoform X1 n=1 Tax=Cucurbita maxima TaxID=3661 RepID=A0A6J1J9E9_CUCMA|nr:uncharacterized protein LOC111484754 isoform X1 [Cucurbita maxima]
MADEPPEFIRMEGYRSIDWNIEEQLSSGDGLSSEKICSAVQKGCSLGKKLLLTGLAISSVPVVLPPLVIMSAFGIAASIPYGVFLASYACTETIMSVWLPIPPALKLDRADEEMVEEDIYEDEEKHMMETAKRGENLDDFDIDVVVVQGGEEGETDIGSKGLAAIEVTNVEFEGNGDNGDEEEEEEELKETRGLLERIRDEGRRDNGFVDENGGVDDVRELEISIEDEKPSDSVEESVLGLLNEVDSAAVYPHADYRTSEGVGWAKSSDETNAITTLSNKAAKSEEAEQLPKVTMIDVIESDEGLSISAMTIEHKVEANSPHKDHRMSSNEELSGEVKIREKIASMKKIVGYKATPLGTYLDEVNALYAFIGVEPPSPMKDSANDDDINLLNQKLQFLMSIVGVK